LKGLRLERAVDVEGCFTTDTVKVWMSTRR
jgi:hypothetical protein